MELKYFSFRLKNAKSFRLLFFSLFLFIFFAHTAFPPAAFGQTTPPLGLTILGDSAKGPKIFSLSPQYPGPFEKVTAEIYGTLNQKSDFSKITWYVNNQEKLSGIGKKTFSFTTGGNGTSQTIRVTIEQPDSKPIEASATIKIDVADVLWEANTYTPPFYKGKALPSPRAEMRAIAIPSLGNQKTLSAQDFSYIWKQGGSTHGDASGYGKDVFLFKAGYLANTEDLTVAISLDGSSIIEKRMTATTIAPKILFYQDKPLEGIRYDSALGEKFFVKSGEITLRAEPYFFSFNTANVNPGRFDWRLGGKKLEINPDNKSEYTIRVPDKGEGGVIVSTNIAHDNIIMQSGSQQITLNYANQ